MGRDAGGRRTLGLDFLVANASTDREIDAAFGTLEAARRDAAHRRYDDASSIADRAQIAALAAATRLPDGYAYREYVAAGGLMSYGVKS